eukprot:1156211-Pleurochrysis_carterae.AAC.1
MATGPAAAVQCARRRPPRVACRPARLPRPAAHAGPSPAWACAAARRAAAPACRRASALQPTRLLPRAPGSVGRRRPVGPRGPPQCVPVSRRGQRGAVPDPTAGHV